MSNLSENLKKYFLEKLVDLLQLVVLLICLFVFTIMAFDLYGVVVGYVSLFATIIIFYFVSKYTNKKFENWNTPGLTKEEAEVFLTVDFVYAGAFAFVLVVLLAPYINYLYLIGFFGLMIGYKEYKKKKNFKLEYPDEKPNQDPLEVYKEDPIDITEPVKAEPIPREEDKNGN